jgi:hypothetical protein
LFLHLHLGIHDFMSSRTQHHESEPLVGLCAKPNPDWLPPRWLRVETREGRAVTILPIVYTGVDNC